MQEQHLTMTSPAGEFIFTRPVILSHAKLIRDTITATLLGPKKDNLSRPNVHRPQDITMWVRDHVDGPVGKSGIALEWVPA